jgi:hypothetical protein
MKTSKKHATKNTALHDQKNKKQTLKNDITLPNKHRKITIHRTIKLFQQTPKHTKQ